MMKLQRFTFTVLLAIAANACDGGTGPDGASLRIVAGSGVTDTIDARLSQALIVEVRDAGGQLVPGHVVRYEAIPMGATQSGFGALVGRLDGAFYTTFLVDTTDESGRSAV